MESGRRQPASGKGWAGYPTNPDGGPANRYAAGTFQYNLPEPGTLTLLGLGGLGLLARRRRGAA